MSRGARAFAWLAVVALVLGHAQAAFAHASLLFAAPADGAVVAQPPATLKLSFNEPVSPLVMRLIGPSGEVIAPAVAAASDAVVLTPPQPLRQGSYVVSWRVVSADGHPVSGSYVFSVGAPSAAPTAGAQNEGDKAVRASLWAAKLVIYAGLFIGIGGVFFREWIANRPARPAPRWLPAVIVAGLFATVASLGLQGLDALDLPLAAIAGSDPWTTGLATSYGWTALAAAAALVLALIAWQSSGTRGARGLSLAAFLGIGLALSLSGHAATAPPRALTTPSVFLHALCVAFWVGSLVPLIAAVRARDGRRTLARFSDVIPFPLGILVITGGVLALVQLDRFDALWTTDYGVVLFRKLVVVAVLLGLGTANRYWLVPRFYAAGARAARGLATSIMAETVLALVILGLVATWRFTPPPRSIVPPGSGLGVHFHGARAMAQIEIDPVRARPAHVEVHVFDGKERPLAAKEVALIYSRPDAGIEPMRRDLVSDGDNLWRLDDMSIPVAGQWRLRVEILIDDFDKVVLEDNVILPHSP